MLKKPKKNLEISVAHGKKPWINIGCLNKAVGPGKNPTLINVRPMFIPDYRVGGLF